MTAYWEGRAVSENRRLMPGKGRWYTSPEYKRFKTALIWTFAAAKTTTYLGKVYVRISVWLRPRMDVQNIIKPVLDALQEARIIEDDKQVWELHVTRQENKESDDAIEVFVNVLA